MYRLKENKINDFLYTGSQLMNREGNNFEYVTKANQLHILQNMETGEMERFTTSELRQMYGKEPNPVWYWCKFTHGENVTNCEPWQTVPGGKHKDAWDAVVGAMEWLEWDEMEESAKASIFIELLDSENIIVGIYDADELKKISCGDYEPWEEL